MRKRVLVAIGAVALLLGAYAIVVYSLKRSEKLLLRRSVKVADATEWQAAVGVLSYGIFRISRPVGANVPDIYFSKWVSTPGSPVVYMNLFLRKGFDGPETSLNGISHLVDSTGGEMCAAMLSNDMKQLLWQSANGEGHIANLDGSHHHHWFIRNLAIYPATWYENRTMVEWTDDNKVLEIQCLKDKIFPLVIWHDARTVKETGRAVLSNTSNVSIKPVVGYPVVNYYPAVDSKGVLLTVTGDWHPQHYPSFVYLDRFDLKANGKLLERHRVTFPNGSELQAIAINNRDNRILWEFSSTYVSPVAVSIHRFIHAFPADPQTTISLYESRCDSSGMHELGHVPYHGINSYNMFNMEWAAEGHCAYFLYENALYRLPVD